jgi:hypothetical protein
MRPLSPLLATTLLAVALPACGGQTKPDHSTGTTGSTTRLTEQASPPAISPIDAPGGYVTEDGDTDGDDGLHASKAGQDDGPLLASYGGRPSRTEAHAIAMLVKRYYAASAAGDGTSACGLLSAEIAKGLESNLSHPEHSSCAVAISPLLAQQHQLLTLEDPATMAIVGIHLRGNLALVALRFKRSFESSILAVREAGAWKIDAFSGSYMT